MPNEMKPFGQVKRALLSAVVICVLMLGNAVAAEWPLDFPAEKFKNIPGGQGMRFFHGVWEPGSRNAGTLPIKVMVGRVESGEPVYSVERYRVIHEAPNYVLVVEQYDSPDVEHPTKFAIYTFESRGLPKERLATLGYYDCNYGTWGTKEAFDWPTEKLLEAFKTSMCFSLIKVKGRGSIGWGSYTRWVRVPAK